jgi:hypothetical protein
MKPSILINAGLTLLLVVIVLLSILLTGTLRARQQMALDLAEVKDVKYGLLNADVWVQKATAILEKRADEFELTPKRRTLLKPILERSLDTLITEADRHLREQNKAAGLKGQIKQGMQDKFMDIEQVKAGIPKYADEILDEMNQPESRRDIARLLKSMLSEAKQTTFAKMDKAPLDAVRARYECRDRAACRDVITQRIRTAEAEALWQLTALLSLTVLLFVAVWAVPGRTDRLRLGLLVLCSTMLMLCGVLTPMMEVEARISELRFVLLGREMLFTDQILYFRSKSVLDVARVLIENAQLKIKLVGFLVLTFGVIFPLLKLAASFLYLYDLKNLRKSSIVEFFALKSGKWSMADVFVIAILMAYVGFDTLISSKLSSLAAASDDKVHILTTNGTSLQTGFFIFLAFCLASMVTSAMIGAQPKEARK